MLKRGFDVILSVLALVVLSPLLLLVGLLVRLTSRGPVLYRAQRVGRDGVPFVLLKFRTMVSDADRHGPAITTAGDSRVTPVGRLLRRAKLDELPQLVNVLRGEMSLVGPRPEAPRYVELYTPAQREILRVRPGITSPASLRFRHEESLLTGPDPETHYIKTIMPAKIALDLDYARRASLGHDLVIILQTLVALFR